LFSDTSRKSNWSSWWSFTIRHHIVLFDWTSHKTQQI
jgi:hypothetical protein